MLSINGYGMRPRSHCVELTLLQLLLLTLEGSLIQNHTQLSTRPVRKWRILIVVVWDAEAAVARFRGFRGRDQALRVPWPYGIS